MPHDSRQQLAFRIRAIGRMNSRIVAGWFNGRPGRRPQRIDASFLVEDLGEVATADKNSHAQVIVLDSDSAPVAVRDFGHPSDSIIDERPMHNVFAVALLLAT